MRFKLLLFFLGSSLLITSIFPHSLEKKEKLSEVQKQYNAQIEKELGVKISVVGGGALIAIESFTSGADIFFDLTINEARRVVLQGAKCMQDAINTNKDLRKYLIEFPFPLSRIAFTLYFEKPYTKEYVVPGILHTCSLYNGKIRYKALKNPGYIWDALSRENIQVIHEETIEEALRIIENENQ